MFPPGFLQRFDGCLLTRLECFPVSLAVRFLPFRVQFFLPPGHAPDGRYTPWQVTPWSRHFTGDKLSMRCVTKSWKSLYFSSINRCCVCCCCTLYDQVPMFLPVTGHCARLKCPTRTMYLPLFQMEALQPAAWKWSGLYLVCLTVSVSSCHPNILGIFACWSTSQVYLNNNILTLINNPLKLNGCYENFLWDIVWFVWIFWWEAMFKLAYKNERYTLNIRHPYLLAMWCTDIYEY